MKKKFITLLVAVLLLGVLILQAVPARAEAGVLDYVVVTPSSASLPAGGTQQFTAQAYDGNNVTISGLTYSWAVVNGGGSINGTGFFTADTVPNTYTNTVEVIVVQDSIVKLALATVTVTAVAGPLDHVVITPSSATVAVGESKQFHARAYDANNVTIPDMPFSWSVIAGGGTIGGTGFFTAGNVTNTYNSTIQAVATQGSIVKSGFASVTVVSRSSPPSSIQSNIRKLVSLVTVALRQIGFDNFLGAQLTIKDNGTTYAIELIPGTVNAISTTALTLLPNGESQTRDFALTSETVIQPNGTTLQVDDRVVVVTANGQTRLVVKIGGQLGQLPPGLRRGEKSDRFEDGKMPPGWFKGKKIGWNKIDDESEEDDD
ncbi:MAG: hypothetical protein ABIH70_08525 [Chloroflexota bacterium]